MKALIIAAHPDDAELALGGTIASLVANGASVTVAFATVSEKNKEIRGFRINAAEKAANILGHKIIWLASGQYDQVEEIPQSDLVGYIDGLVNKIDPCVIFTHTEHDSHYDHIKVSKAVTSSSRRWPEKTLYHFGPNELRTRKVFEFIPNTYIPIDRFIDKKIEALRCYEYPDQGFRGLDCDAMRRRDNYYGNRVGCAETEAIELVSKVELFNNMTPA